MTAKKKAGALTCLTCGATFEPVVTVKGLAVCVGCKRAIVVADGRRAGTPETFTLSNAELKQLRAERFKPQHGALPR